MLLSGDQIEMTSNSQRVVVATVGATLREYAAMSCAPNAFNRRDGLRTLAPGESFEGRWGVALF